MNLKSSVVCILLLFVFSCSSGNEENRISLFNGKNLDSWIVKISGHELNENYGNTYRVEDGLLKVRYDEYEQFGAQFGSLFYKDKFSDYKLRAEYRFIGQQAPGAPDWGKRDSGIQMHCQPPESMAKDQHFPVCFEINFKGGDGVNPRPTGDACFPGADAIVRGELFTEICDTASSVTVHGDEWVTVEVEVQGGKSIKHWVNGQFISEYSRPQFDKNSADAQRLLTAGADSMLTEGYISLQSNSHPIDFRKIELLVLNVKKDKDEPRDAVAD